MIRSVLSSVRFCAARVGGFLALAPAILMVAAPLPVSAAPPSQIVEEHLIAQAGLSVGLGVNLAAQFLTVLTGINRSGCSPEFGGVSTLGTNSGSTTAETAVIDIYYDAACQKPYFTDSLEAALFGSSGTLAYTGQFIAPNGAILGAVSLAQQLEQSGSNILFSEKGTYKAVAGTGQPPVRVGLACTLMTGASIVFTCQEGVAQDFPSLKTALGTIASFTMTLTPVNSTTFAMSVTGTNAKLATGKLGSLSITVTSPTTLGFQGQAAIVGHGSLSGSSPAFGVIYPASTVWLFDDAQHATKFSISTAGSLSSSGKVIDTATHAALATLLVDKSGTGTITYSDKTKAKITNWTLAD